MNTKNVKTKCGEVKGYDGVGKKETEKHIIYMKTNQPTGHTGLKLASGGSLRKCKEHTQNKTAKSKKQNNNERNRKSTILQQSKDYS